MDAGDWYGSSGGPAADRTGSNPVPRYIAYTAEETKGLFGGASVSRRPAAPTEAFVCGACGWFEEYVKAPTNVAWDQVEGARWYKPPGTGYR